MLFPIILSVSTVPFTSINNINWFVFKIDTNWLICESKRNVENRPIIRTLKMGSIGCPETSVRNYHYSLRNNPEKGSSQILRRGSLQSRFENWFLPSNIVYFGREVQTFQRTVQWGVRFAWLRTFVRCEKRRSSPLVAEQTTLCRDKGSCWGCRNKHFPSLRSDKQPTPWRK